MVMVGIELEKKEKLRNFNYKTLSALLILGQFLVFQKIVFSLKNKRFHKFVMAYSESSQ